MCILKEKETRFHWQSCSTPFLQPSLVQNFIIQYISLVDLSLADDVNVWEHHIDTMRRLLQTIWDNIVEEAVEEEGQEEANTCQGFPLVFLSLLVDATHRILRVHADGEVVGWYKRFSPDPLMSAFTWQRLLGIWKALFPTLSEVQIHFKFQQTMEFTLPWVLRRILLRNISPSCHWHHEIDMWIKSITFISPMYCHPQIMMNIDID